MGTPQQIESWLPLIDSPSSGEAKAHAIPSGPDLRSLVAGLETEVPLLGGGRCRYLSLDNAATTPPFQAVLKLVEDFAPYYSSVHRGTGFKSHVSTELYERCRAVMLAFFDADPDYHTCVFCANATDAVNSLCRRLRLAKDELVLTTIMEHHSNMLPWRFAGSVEHVGILDKDGSLDMAELTAKLEAARGRVRLVAVTGASNVTGFLPPIHKIARLAHEAGAMILVDAAQLAAHRPISMGPASDPERIDFLAASGHKMYAPFGSGVLIGPRDFFAKSAPDRVGGGSVDIVTTDGVEWAEPPERDEAGTPNLMGSMALARAAKVLSQVGLETVARHERELTAEALHRLIQIEGVRIYGEADPELKKDRGGVIPILLDGMEHTMLASVLSYEWGIGVRNGCFCAHPYVKDLLGVTNEEFERFSRKIRQGDRSGLPGFVRISFGLYNTVEEIDRLAEALEDIRQNGPRGSYVFDKSTGHYYPESGAFDLSDISFL